MRPERHHIVFESDRLQVPERQHHKDDEQTGRHHRPADIPQIEEPAVRVLGADHERNVLSEVGEAVEPADGDALQGAHDQDGPVARVRVDELDPVGARLRRVRHARHKVGRTDRGDDAVAAALIHLEPRKNVQHARYGSFHAGHL